LRQYPEWIKRAEFEVVRGGKGDKKGKPTLVMILLFSLLAATVYTCNKTGQVGLKIINHARQGAWRRE
jgi:hypothetical protein